MFFIQSFILNQTKSARCCASNIQAYNNMTHPFFSVVNSLNEISGTGDKFPLNPIRLLWC